MAPTRSRPCLPLAKGVCPAYHRPEFPEGHAIGLRKQLQQGMNNCNFNRGRTEQDPVDSLGNGHQSTETFLSVKYQGVLGYAKPWEAFFGTPLTPHPLIIKSRPYRCYERVHVTPRGIGRSRHLTGRKMSRDEQLCWLERSSRLCVSRVHPASALLHDDYVLGYPRECTADRTFYPADIGFLVDEAAVRYSEWLKFQSRLHFLRKPCMFQHRPARL
jgi:hypothetical protein